MKDDLKKYIDQNRDDFDIHQPSPELWNRIKKNIPGQPKVVEKQKKWTIGYFSVAASVLLVLTAGVYFFMNEQDKAIEIVKTKTKTNVKEPQTATTSVKKEVEIENLNPIEVVSNSEKTGHKSKTNNLAKTEIIESNKNEKAEIFNLLNDQESTSNRIEALAKLNEIETLNSNEIETLKQIALHDNNTNVRLNAIEVLSQKIAKSTASDEMTALFLEQDNPMVQMELIGIIAHYNNEETNQKLIKKLQEIVLDPQAMPFVKDEAYAVLLKKHNN